MGLPLVRKKRAEGAPLSLLNQLNPAIAQSGSGKGLVEIIDAQ
jgi:hypothetical protein